MPRIVLMLAVVLAFAGLIGVNSGTMNTAAQDAASSSLASHPIVGSWLVFNPDASVSNFAADGGVTIVWSPSYIDPVFGTVLQSPALGVWEPDGERGIQFTAVQVLSDADGTVLGTFTLEGAPVVSEDGQAFTDEGTTAKATIRDATNAIVMEIGGENADEPLTPPVHGTRIQVGDAGFPDVAAMATPAEG